MTREPSINIQVFRRILIIRLEASGHEPVELDVTREIGPPSIIRVRWSMHHGLPLEQIAVAEAVVIDRGGPDWVAALIRAKRAQRREMMRSA
ncbi:hypothetical protein [Amaricoccus solimangrovi]|uniref:Uncharacterized protein n=1 Tax=Amaricoccus solimangrovi TaxID=2589815 RepID=A0A501WUW1_9RHOB|nr:hypothetical protein [Amaricoccus solimangrovi]TPE53069.1 hypothetical protein FJM51_03320 [Amaricoccus solimangrovi]